uniref:Uncharacterized protein n=1 Tax=Ciona savignyi TaxID=51511 RepID=H2ZC79_CIOSA
MMSKKNKQVQNLKSTVSTQEKTLKEVQSQVVELRTQMQALWSLLSPASPEILLTKLCPKCSLVMRPSGGAKPPMNNAMETTSSSSSAKDPENTANDVLPCLRNASHTLKRKLHNSDPKDASSNSKCTKLL